MNRRSPELPAAADAKTVMDWLTRRYPSASRQTLRRMVQAGRILINGHPVRRVDRVLQAEDVLSAVDRPKTAARPALPFKIIFEDRDLLIVEKPAGMLTSTVPREPRPTLLGHVRDYLKVTDPAARAGVIHRLDQQASGLLVFSKTDLAYQSLKRQFFRHDVERHYRAVVHGIPREPAGRIETHLVERTDGTVHSTRQTGRGMIAITEYAVIERRKKSALIGLKLHTGRKHQIRVHLSERGNPVMGDRVYGPATKSPAPRLMLAATRLGFTHPRTGKLVQLEIPPPAEMSPAEPPISAAP